ncbi:MAG TPA: serine hydrolase domain-containing protein [Ideonella sp.]|uniref:serine hydrolase domain-containing protein n=1 Tax=Ideonella sp. TaxID=1929293 RepID=UPI002C5445DC|nr:serine hydrolase domain-containing protein [Ideonella sp.]HSI51533.1 serine hydrolase domain-containing protein [Ideonella sp.]
MLHPPAHAARRHFQALALSALLALNPLATRAAPLAAAEADAIDSTVREALRAQHAPGAVVAIRRGSEPVFRRAYGLADTTSGRAMHEDTAFEIGSITKQMTAAAVLQLVQAGRLSLDDAVGKFVPTFPAAARVSVRQLLQQTSGLPDFAGTEAFAANATQTPARFEQVLATVQAAPLQFTPGSRFRYSNTNYLLLARIVETVSGQPFASRLGEQVLGPAGMAHTGASDGTLRWPDLASGHSTEAGQVQPAPRFQPSWIRGAGELVSTADDLLAWADALAGGRVVAPAQFQAMATPAMLNDGQPDGYGFGLFVDRQAGHPRLWHGGGTLGFSSSLMLYPADQLTIVVLVNHEALNASALSASLFEVLHPEARAAHAPVPGEDPALTQQVRAWLVALKQGTQSADIALAPAVRLTLQNALDNYGRPEALVYRGQGIDGERRYLLRFGAQWFRFDFSRAVGGALRAATITPE